MTSSPKTIALKLAPCILPSRDPIMFIQNNFVSTTPG